MLTAPPPFPVFNAESVEIVLNCSDGCLVHLASLKLKKETVKLREGGFVLQFLWVIVGYV